MRLERRHLWFVKILLEIGLWDYFCPSSKFKEFLYGYRFINYVTNGSNPIGATCLPRINAPFYGASITNYFVIFAS